MLKASQREFRVPIAKNQKPKGPEHNPWWWNPNRIGVREAPRDFMDRLRDVDPDYHVRIIWNPITERWQVWAFAPRVNTPVCQGWKLLFVNEFDDEYRPLDERTLAAIYERSGRKWGNLFEYWLKVEQATERDRLLRERSRESDVMHSAGEYFDYTKIKNIGRGSKFSESHA